MSDLIYPTATTNVSDDFTAHVVRGSVNPGTDYTCPYGTPVHSVKSGIVTDIGTSLTGSGGRVIHVNHFDGSGADYLHLSHVGVYEGQPVNQGDVIGLSGASGYGSEWYYGAHLHISYRNNHSAYYGNVQNLDFDAIIRGQVVAAAVSATPIIIPTTEEEDEMSKLFIVPVSDDKTKFVFGGQNIVPIAVPNGLWLGVLTDYADAVNETDDKIRGEKLSKFTTAQWKLIRQALSNRELSADLDKAEDQKGM